MSEPDETAVTGLHLIEHDPLATNTHETVVELSDAVFSVLSMSYNVKEVGN
jgi:hypothetical protein